MRDDLGRYTDNRYDARVVLRAALRDQGLWACAEYRFGHFVRSKRRRPLVALSFVLHKIIEMTTGISISPDARIGPGLYIGHFSGIIVGRGVTMGQRCSISQGVTIGTSVSGERRGSPTIGDGCYIAPGAKVFGPIHIGDRVAIGANAVVNRDLPSDCTAVGVPARPLQRPGCPAAD